MKINNKTISGINNPDESEKGKTYANCHFVDCRHLSFHGCSFINCTFTRCTFGHCTSNFFSGGKFDSCYFGCTHNIFSHNRLCEVEIKNDMPCNGKHNGIYNNRFEGMDISKFVPAFLNECEAIRWDFNDFLESTISVDAIRGLARKCNTILCYNGDSRRPLNCGLLFHIDLSDLSLSSRCNLIANILTKTPTARGSYDYYKRTYEYHIDTNSSPKEHPVIILDSRYNAINDRVIPFSKDFSGSIGNLPRSDMGPFIVWKPTDKEFPLLDLDDVFAPVEDNQPIQKSKQDPYIIV